MQFPRGAMSVPMVSRNQSLVMSFLPPFHGLEQDCRVECCPMKEADQAKKSEHYCRASCVLSRYCLIRSYSAEAMTEKMMSMTFSMAIRDPMAPLLMVTSGDEM